MDFSNFLSDLNYEWLIQINIHPIHISFISQRTWVPANHRRQESIPISRCRNTSIRDSARSRSWWWEKYLSRMSHREGWSVLISTGKVCKNRRPMTRSLGNWREKRRWGSISSLQWRRRSLLRISPSFQILRSILRRSRRLRTSSVPMRRK